MTKLELGELLARRIGLPRIDAHKAVKAIYEIFEEQLLKGEGVYNRDFGSFIVKQKAGGTATHFTTGERIPVPPKAIPFFIPSVRLRALIKESGKITVRNEREER
jgi:nucleoid DNA-binding protein